MCKENAKKAINYVPVNMTEEVVKKKVKANDGRILICANAISAIGMHARWY